MKISFPNSGSATIIPATTASFSSLTLRSVTDYPDEKLVIAETNELGKITVYSGSSYDSVGNWTIGDVTASLFNRYKPE